MSDEDLANIQNYVARRIEELHSRIVNEVRSSLGSLLAEMAFETKALPEIDFQVNHTSLALEQFMLDEQKTEMKFKGDRLVAIASGFAIGNFVLPGIGGLIGGALGVLANLDTSQSVSKSIDRALLLKSVQDAALHLTRDYQEVVTMYLRRCGTEFEKEIQAEKDELGKRELIALASKRREDEESKTRMSQVAHFIEVVQEHSRYLDDCANINMGMS